MGHFISDERLIRLGHQLLCIILAGYDFPNLYRGDGDPDPLDDLRSLEDSDLSEQIVMLAALARANDDEHQTLSAVNEVLPDGVGTIEQDGTSKVLTPREACNKYDGDGRLNRQGPTPFRGKAPNSTCGLTV